ncbi:MAG: leucine-rich repeat protein [Dysgonamonadaceae bacterium]|jgi:hypothetical protein|nr:leucine-rich repeat protein [Dysgonamonadaceae bacterium]
MKQLLLSFFLLLTIGSYAQTSGTAGNLSWTLDNNGILTISGTGAMPNYSSRSSEQSPWYGSPSIKEVKILEGVTSIGEYAFTYCRNLTSITIPESVKTIENNAFLDCGLKSVTVPGSVKTIGSGAFYGCSSLTSVAILEGVRTIGNSAFRDCSSLTSITIPESVTTIEHYAFEDCSSLTSITIPGSVETIGESAFSGCSSLTSVTIPESIRTIYGSAFSGCSNLISINIPSGVTYLGSNAFADCSDLTSIVLPSGLTYIGAQAFYNCSSLTSITIPNGVGSIGEHTFENCSRLTSIIIPGNVTTIGEYAFTACSNLTSITIPKSVTTIGNYAFEDCSSLNEITVNWTSTPPSINSKVFFALTLSQIALYIPEGTKDVYDNADVWNSFRLVTNYALSIGTFTGGSVTVDKTRYDEGDPVTLTIVPDAGYVLSNISAYKTGNAGITVALFGTGNSRTFTMPACDVTVEAVFRNPTMEAAVNTARELIEAATYHFAQAEANTNAAVKTGLAAQINALAGISATGIDPVTASAITISNFTAAVTDGADGSFTFTVSLSKGNATATTASRSGTITAAVNERTPVISAHPQDAKINIGGSVTLTVTASVNDGGTLSYQWYSNTSNSNTGGKVINGATGNSYSPPTTVKGTIWYYVVVTNTNNRMYYTVSVTSRAASVTADNIYQITVAPAINGSVTANPDAAASEETVTLTISPATGYMLDRITAYKIDGTGASVVLYGSGNGRIFIMPACGIIIEATFKVAPPSSMENVSLSKISIYPNPVKHDLYIQSDYPIEKVEIYNQSGICVLADEAFTGKTDVSHLSAGVYYVRVYANGALENRKIVVEN